jgi:hypothetical protein
MPSIDPCASSDDETDALLQGAPIFKRKTNPQPTPIATHSRTTLVTPVVAPVATTIAAAPPAPVAAVIPPSAAKKRVAAAAATKPKPKPKKKKKCDMPHCLIWVCTHGKGQGRAWSQSKLKIVGVYSSKAKAEEAKRNVMSQHECCGHGDILVGGCWDDEIDLVIREAPMMLTSEEEY